MPPLRQAAIPLSASGRERGGQQRENQNITFRLTRKKNVKPIGKNLKIEDFFVDLGKSVTFAA